jgi:hypothetical protein
MPNDPNAALFGGTTVEVTLEGGQKEQVTVRELTVREWQQAMGYLERDEDNGLMELVCSKPEGWALTLSPSSFMAIVAQVKENNLSFFEFATDKIQRRVDRVASMPSEVIKSLMEQQAQPASKNSSGRLRQRPA